MNAFELCVANLSTETQQCLDSRFRGQRFRGCGEIDSNGKTEMMTFGEIC